MRLKTTLVTAVCAVGVGAFGAGSAFAGEVNGHGAPTAAPEHANSICAFSGQNDSPTDAFPEGGRTQSWGQLVSKLGPMGGAPGQACRGGSNTGE